MTKTLIGFDYEGVHCVKITKGNIDPITTPDDTPGVFLFNSKDSIQNRLSAIDVTYGVGNAPAGASPPNFLRWIYRSTGYDWTYIQREYYTGIDYDIPLTDFIMKNPSTGFYTKGRQLRFRMETSYRGAEYIYLNSASERLDGEQGWKIDYLTNVNGNPFANPRYLYPRLLCLANSGSVATDVVMWNLPGNNVPINQEAFAPKPGLDVIRIDSAGLKVSKPGIDVNDALPHQLAVSSDQRPIKIIAARDIEVPLGTTFHDLGVEVPENSICDIQYYLPGQPIAWPAIPGVVPIGADWKLTGRSIQFVNNDVACRARFIVIANDKVARTTGNNRVLRQFTENGQSVVQFLRPGSGDPPSFSDIVIDSRWPTLRIRKEGYFDVSPGAQVTRIPIEPGDYLPFVKFMVICGGKASAGGGSYYASSVRPPQVGMFKAVAENPWQESGDTTYAEVSATDVAFHTFRGREKFHFWTSQTSSSGVQRWVDNVVMPDEVLGIRYYIFDIPN